MADQQAVKQLIAMLFNIDAVKLQESSTLAGDLGANKMVLIELAAELEKHFGVNISPEDAVKFKTVKDIYDFIGWIGR